VPWLPAVYGARALPLLPVVAAIAIYDQPVSAIFYGAFAGVLCDLAIASRGFHAIYFTCAAFACAMLLRYFLNRNVFSIALLSFGITVLYLLLRWFADFAALPNLSSAERTLPLLTESLPNLVYTMILVPLCVTLVRVIIKRTSRRQSGVLVD